MECILEEKTKRIYQDGNKVYTLLDMGAYVGHRSRQWYEKAPECWRLMFYDEKTEDGKICHAEALVDQFGEYTRLIIEHGSTKRVLMFTMGTVHYDAIDDTSGVKDLLGLGKSYYSLNKDIYDSGRPRINDYLNLEHTFISEDGKVFDKSIPSDSEVVDFFAMNDKLISKSRQK